MSGAAALALAPREEALPITPRFVILGAMRIVEASFVSIILVVLGCNASPCGEGQKETKDPGFGFVDVGLPEGATACTAESGPDIGPYVFYREGTEEDAAAKLVAHMAAKGWKELPIPGEVEKTNFNLAVGGTSTGITKLFGKDGSKERRYGSVQKHQHVTLELYKDECTPTSEGAVNDMCK